MCGEVCARKNTETATLTTQFVSEFKLASYGSEKDIKLSGTNVKQFNHKC